MLLSKLSNLLITNGNEMAFSEWVMVLLGKVQSSFSQNVTKETIGHSLFLLDLLVFCIVTNTGCAAFVNDDLSMKNQVKWRNHFPEALWLLSKRLNWAPHIPRVIKSIFTR